MLFGQSQQNISQQQSQAQQQSSIFGSAPSVFGSNPQSSQRQQQGGLFSNLNQSQQNTVLQNSLGASLGNTANQPAPQSNVNSIFGSSLLGAQGQQAQQQQQQQNALQQPLLQSQLGGSRLGGGMPPPPPREKAIPEQIAVLAQKWVPSEPDCALQAYLYNQTDPAFVPYYQPSEADDAAKWASALAAAPTPSSIPVLASGFHALAARIVTQETVLHSLRERLHEILSSLTAVLAGRTAERIAGARRRHAALARRTLALAASVQMLRHAGYALDAGEEALGAAVAAVERASCDAVYAAREEEVWARLVRLRERARWLEEEGKRLQAGGEGGGVSEDVLAQTRTILGDYGERLGALRGEMMEVEGAWSALEDGHAAAAAAGVS